MEAFERALAEAIQDAVEDGVPIPSKEAQEGARTAYGAIKDAYPTARLGVFVQDNGRIEIVLQMKPGRVTLITELDGKTALYKTKNRFMSLVVAIGPA